MRRIDVLGIGLGVFAAGGLAYVIFQVFGLDTGCQWMGGCCVPALAASLLKSYEFPITLNEIISLWVFYVVLGLFIVVLVVAWVIVSLTFLWLGISHSTTHNIELQLSSLAISNTSQRSNETSSVEQRAPMVTLMFSFH